jgi:hypothetical protein
MDLENFYVTPCFSHDYHLMLVEYIKPQNTKSVCTTREKETDRNTFFSKKNPAAFLAKSFRMSLDSFHSGSTLWKQSTSG